jgi:hypothetical protein
LKTVIVILATFFFLNCSAQEKGSIQTGKYSYIKWTQLEMAWISVTKGIHHFFVGSELVLNCDSSFTYKTCGNIMTGIWKYNNDSLSLIANSNRWRSDSLDKYGYQGKWPEVPVKPIILVNKLNYLELLEFFDNGEKGIQRLKLNVP